MPAALLGVALLFSVLGLRVSLLMACLPPALAWVQLYASAGPGSPERAALGIASLCANPAQPAECALRAPPPHPSGARVR